MAEEVNEIKTETTEAPMGFGARIAAAREAAGISLGDMAAMCRLSVQQLHALEVEDVASLPEPVYVRAFIRGVANILKIDAKELQDDYSRRYGNGVVANSANIGQVPARDPREELVINQGGRHRGLKVSLFILFLCAIAAGGWALYADQFGETSRTEAEKIAEGVNESAVEAAEAAQAVLNSSTPVEKSSPVPSAAKPSEPAPVPKQEPAAEPAVLPAAPQPKEALPVGTHRVVLEASAQCWTQVTTPDGKRLVARELKPGERVELTVPKDSNFRIGNVPGLAIEVDGENYNFAHTVRNGVAGFVLR